jgi:hypothetical protein
MEDLGTEVCSLLDNMDFSPRDLAFEGIVSGLFLLLVIVDGNYSPSSS